MKDNPYLQLRTYMQTCIGLGVVSALLALTVSDGGMRIAWFVCSVLAVLLALVVWTVIGHFRAQAARIEKLERGRPPLAQVLPTAAPVNSAPPKIAAPTTRPSAGPTGS